MGMLNCNWILFRDFVFKDAEELFEGLTSVVRHAGLHPVTELLIADAAVRMRFPNASGAYIEYLNLTVVCEQLEVEPRNVVLVFDDLRQTRSYPSASSSSEPNTSS